MVQLILLVLMLAASPVGATTYYVSTSGNNANDGLSESTPKRTIEHCVDLMVAGDTCLVRGGTYNETSTIRFRRSGAAGSPIRLANYPGESPVIVWPGVLTNEQILIQHSSGSNVAMGYIIIEGLEITNGYDGIKFYSMHDSLIQNNWIHHNRNQGILAVGGHHVTITRNIINGQGPHSGTANKEHGIYAHGDSYTITHNIFYDNHAYGIQQNGSGTSAYDPSKHPSTAFAGAANWVVSDNTFAYEWLRSGAVIWGDLSDNARYENNIFYENNTQGLGSAANAIQFTAATGATGVLLRNNHAYASGSGGTGFTSGTAPGDLVSTGNVVDVSPPQFVLGGSNALPGSPDFRLTASSPVNIARSNEFPNNSTNVVGAFKTLANPTCSITANKITCSYPQNTATPLQNLSTAGVTINCTGSACPGSPTASSVSKVAGTDSQLEITVAGISGNACVASNQTWTVTYNSASGTWTANDNIGPYPGLHQKMFSFTGLSVTNNCDGSGPPDPPSGAYIAYAFDEGSGTTAINSGSLGSAGNGTLNNGVTWESGPGVFVLGSSSQNVSMNYGSGVDPSTQSLTIGFLVNIQAGQESLGRTVFGAPFVTDRRLYISTRLGAWAIGVQGSSDSTVSDLAVDVGPQHICMEVNATTDTVTLYKNGVASTTGGVKSITSSYTLPGNFEIGRLPGATNGPTAIYQHFELYRSVESCADLYAATQAPPIDPAGTFSQTAIQFEDVYRPSAGGGPTVLSSPGNAKKVVKGGAVAAVVQIECDDCEQTAFRIEARDNGTGAWLQIPNTPTASNLYMWGTGGQQFLNNFLITYRVLENGCSAIAGGTILTASQVPQVTLPANGCVMLRYLIRVSPTASGYTEIRAAKQGGVAFTGTYVLGRIDIIDPQAGGVGF